MRTLIKANQIYQDVQKLDDEIQTLNTAINNVINNDLKVELEYKVLDTNKKNNILNEDGDLTLEKNKTKTSFVDWIQYTGEYNYVNKTMAEELKNSNDKELDASEFVIMFAALLSYNFKKLEIMKNLIVLLVLVFGISNAQQNLEFSLYQDLKLATMEDDYGNEPYTMDVVFKFRMNGHQQEYGYMYVAPVFEYAEIAGLYKRYAVEVGYTFNELILKDFEASAGINYGLQERYGLNWLVFGLDGEIGYSLTPNLKVKALAQMVERKDLKEFYGTYKIRFSGFVGVTLSL
jgi:hypothetical protein